MNILGLNYFFHDSTACIVADGKLVVAIEEERLTREKHTNAFPEQAIAKCLEVAGMSHKDIDHVAVSIKPNHKRLDKCVYGMRHFLDAKPFVKHELWETYRKQQKLWAWFNSTWPSSKKPQLHFIEHHISHIAGSFFVSPYDRAALLSLDGAGEWATAWLGVGEGNNVTCFSESFFPYSLGSFYEAATEFCGFRPNYDEGKTMGLAPFGDPSVFYPTVKEIAKVDSDTGKIQIDLSYFNYQFWGYQRCSEKFYRTFGNPRMRHEEFKENHHNVAAAFQKVLEDHALEFCKILRRQTDAEYLVISGGVALNSVMNGRIIRESDFKDIYVIPAAGDNGTAIGAAYYLYNKVLGKDRGYVHMNPYVGNSYTDSQIVSILNECKLKHTRHDDIAAVGARLLHEGNIIGWHQGRMEIGPRALGNRSILANPTLPHMKDKINAEVKHREAYRPFAPSAVAEHRSEFFDISVEAPFMLKVCPVRPEKRHLLPAITHVDGSARLQTVRAETNPLYHEIIRRFGELSGVPVVLNTSFNIQGEPIVESPIDAIRCYFSTGLDVLIIGNYLIKK